MNHPTNSITHIVANVSSLNFSFVEDRLPKEEPRFEVKQRKTNIIRQISTQIILAVAAVFILHISASAEETFIVRNTSDIGRGSNKPCSALELRNLSLRQAIDCANSNSSTSGFDLIHFKIPLTDSGCDATTRVCTIRPGENFPHISNIEIDGYEQPGASVNTLAQGTNAVLKIEIRGNREAGLDKKAFILFGGGATLKGLIVNNFPGYAVEVGSGNSILGCFIGTDATGTIAVPNGRPNGEGGIVLGANLSFVGPAHIGTVLRADRNIISGNAGAGINIPGGGGSDLFVNFNQIQNNLIGTKADGISPLGNGSHGIFMRNGSATRIVGNLIANNVIAFNGGIGVNIADAGVGVSNPPMNNRISANSALPQKYFFSSAKRTERK